MTGDVAETGFVFFVNLFSGVFTRRVVPFFVALLSMQISGEINIIKKPARFKQAFRL
jgi:hypothetical protein